MSCACVLYSLHVSVDVYEPFRETAGFLSVGGASSCTEMTFGVQLPLMLINGLSI